LSAAHDRAAIIGLGRWGRSLVTSVQGQSDDIRFVAAHTRTRASAEDFCRDQQLPLVSSYEQILADPNVDAVVLATPHSRHEQQILAAAAAGKHNPCRETDHARPQQCRRCGRCRTPGPGVTLAVGYCRRFHPSVVGIRSRLADGLLGNVVPCGAAHHQHRAVHRA